MLSEHDYLFGSKKGDNKIIDVKSSDDFPTLELGGVSSASGLNFGKPSKGKKGFIGG